MQGANKYAYQPPLVPSLLGSSFQPIPNEHLLHLLFFPKFSVVYQSSYHTFFSTCMTSMEYLTCNFDQYGR